MTTSPTPWWRSAAAKVGAGLALALLAIILTDLRALTLRAAEAILGDWLEGSTLALEVAEIQLALDESPQTRAEVAVSVAAMEGRLDAMVEHCSRFEARILDLERRAAALEQFSRGRRFTREDGDRLESELRAEIARVAARIPP